MASKQLFAILAIIVPSIALATEYIVGDDQGWTINYNYSEWTTGKMFQVGDSLVFNYNKDSHNVFKVSGPQFRACDVPSPNATNSFTTGHDIIPLMTAGNKWYICGKVGHCDLGQKLVIYVISSGLSPIGSIAPAPTPDVTLNNGSWWRRSHMLWWH